MKLHPFAEAVAGLQFQNCFNPYTDRCPKFDCAGAANRRVRIFSKILESAANQPIDAIWVGRDLGHRGGRRTGLALTDDVHVDHHLKRWNISPIKRLTTGDMVSERTAAVIWEQLNRIDLRIFLWNVFPLHPHEPDNPFTNRQHNARERKAGEKLLFELILLLRPSRVIAIGNDAATVASQISPVPVLSVRHPSYGGQSQFVRQISELYGLPMSSSCATKVII